MCISATTRRITAVGQGEPAMMPVRSDERSNSPKRGCPSSAMNMVGTPCSAVQRSFATASSTASGSNASPDRTLAAPCVMAARTPSTMPKQWYSGTGMHTLSAAVSRMPSPTKNPLLTMLKCVSAAPFGVPVVPLVNWML